MQGFNEYACRHGVDEWRVNKNAIQHLEPTPRYLYLWVGGLRAGLITSLDVDAPTTIPTQLSIMIANDNLAPGLYRPMGLPLGVERKRGAEALKPVALIGLKKSTNGILV